jgi:hypothetical protein
MAIPMKRLGLACVVLAVAFLTMLGSAWADTSTTICVPERAGQPVVSGTNEGKCAKANYSAVVLPAGGLATLNKILPHVNYIESGIGGKPTLQFSGVNLQVVNGEGKTASVNGEGNLVIGYDENPGVGRGKQGSQTGSHDLILGDEQEFTSYGGLLAGAVNSITAPFASVSGGFVNTSSGQWASVSGGQTNVASSMGASVSGGNENSAAAFDTSITGGRHNEVGAEYGSVHGGFENAASGVNASILGGESNTASGYKSTIGGGYKNLARGAWSSIFGGKGLTAANEYEAIP